MPSSSFLRSFLNSLSLRLSTMIWPVFRFIAVCRPQPSRRATLPWSQVTRLQSHPNNNDDGRRSVAYRLVPLMTSKPISSNLMSDDYLIFLAKERSNNVSSYSPHDKEKQTNNFAEEKENPEDDHMIVPKRIKIIISWWSTKCFFSFFQQKELFLWWWMTYHYIFV